MILQEETDMEVACQLDDLEEDLHPIAFRVHTHILGRSVTGWKVLEGGKEWKMLGKKNPQLPQMFYPVEEAKEELTIRNGDTLAAR